MKGRISNYVLRKYADYFYTKWEKNILWNQIDPYRRPKSFTPLVSIYIAAFYTGVIGAAITEQLYKVLFRFYLPFFLFHFKSKRWKFRFLCLCSI